jgi:secreted PhoX family phosphatase
MTLMKISRRRFLGRSAAAGAALIVPGLIDAALAGLARAAPEPAYGFGPLEPDPKGLLDLPAGFRYRALSTATLGRIDDPRFSQRLGNGDPVPALHDGMAAFAGPDGLTILVRNHEMNPGDGPGVDPVHRHAYDPEGTGGTTTLWVDRERRLVRSFASLSGTFRNCAGGPTPWGSWLSAEECTYMPGAVDGVNHDRRPDVKRPHGYVFEVDARAKGLVDPVPIRAMGRFYHEAVAVDPATATVYLTEDRDDGLLYRYVPDAVSRGIRAPSEMRPGDLARGGTLEALRIPARPSLLTQNWIAEGEPRRPIAPGAPLKANWVRIPDVEPDMDQRVISWDRIPLADRILRDPRGRRTVETAPGSTRGQGQKLGCALFARAEGITFHAGAVYVCCTNGGPARCGQVWRFDIARQELTLMFEAAGADALDGPDNLCPAPWGDLMICEDGRGEDRLIGLTPEGRTYTFARNALGKEELAGACFAPDGRTLFVNIQQPGITFAIWGPWERVKRTLRGTVRGAAQG